MVVHHRSLDGEPREPRRFDTIPARESRLAFERERVIPALNKLLARNAVLASHEAQYELLEQQGLLPGELDAALGAAAPDPDDAGVPLPLVLLRDANGVAGAGTGV